MSNDFRGGLDDIQELAKSTFEMSGLNQHDWGMIEPGKALETAFDEPAIGTSVSSNVPYTRAPDEMPDLELPSMDLPPAPTEPTFSQKEVEEMIKAEVARVLEEMHFQIQDRINHELKQVTEEIIPDIAEKMIKDEIHKLLSNPPV